jgi:hypothetical protein
MTKIITSIIALAALSGAAFAQNFVSEYGVQAAFPGKAEKTVKDTYVIFYGETSNAQVGVALKIQNKQDFPGESDESILTRVVYGILEKSTLINANISQYNSKENGIFFTYEEPSKDGSPTVCTAESIVIRGNRMFRAMVVSGYPQRSADTCNTFTSHVLIDPAISASPLVLEQKTPEPEIRKAIPVKPLPDPAFSRRCAGSAGQRIHGPDLDAFQPLFLSGYS